MVDSVSSSPIAAPSPVRRIAVIALRTLMFLALSLWLGGLFFFGAMAAGPMFRIARAAGQGDLAPQMVAVMLGRFGFVLGACGVILLVGWWLEGRLSAPRGAIETRLWRVQGAASAVLLAIAIYLGVVLMPQIQAMQNGASRAANGALKAQFDAAHNSYTSLAGVSIYLGFAVLVALMWRISRES